MLQNICVQQPLTKLSRFSPQILRKSCHPRYAIIWHLIEIISRGLSIVWLGIISLAKRCDGAPGFERLTEFFGEASIVWGANIT